MADPEKHVGRRPAAVMAAELRRTVTREYPAMAQELLGPLIDLLRVAREGCGGDIEKFLVLLVVAVRTTEHPGFKAYSQEQLLSGEVPIFPSLGTNVRSIAASLGMPKETVRRKVTEMLEAGWFARQGNNLYFTSAGYRELAPVREAIERLAVSNFNVVSALVQPPSQS